LKSGRNDPCVCGSGKKYKNCCMGNGATHPSQHNPPVQVVLGQVEAMYRERRFAELIPLLGVLVKRDPASASLWKILGSALQAQGEDGLFAFRKAATLLPKDLDVQIGLGRALIQRNLVAEAADSFRQAVAIDPENPVALFNLGDTLLMSGKFAEAEPFLRRVVLMRPNADEGITSLALTLGELGLLKESEDLCRRALQLTPDNALAYFCLGTVLIRSTRLDDARKCFIAALKLRPSWVPALEGLGNALQELGNTTKAEECYLECLRLDPGFTNASNNLGKLLVEQNRFIEAERCFGHALKSDPDNTFILEHLGNALMELGRSEEARRCYLQAIEIEPDNASTRLALAASAIPVIANTTEEAANAAGLFAGALDELSAWINSDRKRKASSTDLAGAQLPFFLAYRNGDHVAQLSRYGDLLSGCLQSGGCHDRPHRDKIRLLIVSNQVRRNSVWTIVLRGILFNLDRSRFEVFIYHVGNKEDDETAFARSQADGWRDRHTITDPEAWLKAAKEDCPDVIFYPEIGMSSMSYFLAAHRLAPLQVASWGHPITTGLATLDVFYSGELLEARDADTHYRERLVRLPGTGCCTTAVTMIAEPIPDIAATLSKMRGPRFLMPHSAMKFDPADDDLYARIAVETGESVFILLRDEIRPWAMDSIVCRLESAFRNRDLDPGLYLVVVPWLSPEKFLSLLDISDVYLDNPNFSGYTTAWLALHRGMPIVTKEGRYLRQRLASGLLKSAGLFDTIANEPDEYVAIAARLAKKCGESNSRDELRATILSAAPLVDNNLRVVKSFEESLITELRDKSRR
jgi:protein O-GlcNAc transferase